MQTPEAAPGRIIVPDRTKVIQPLAPTMATADIASVQEQRKTQVLDALRIRKLLQLLSKQKLPSHVPPAQKANFAPKHPRPLPPSPALLMDARTQAQRQSEWQDIQAKFSKLD